MKTPEKFFEGKYVASVKSLAKFELKAVLGRWLGRKRAASSARKLLQLGCGDSPSPEFVNLDFYRWYKRDQIDIMHDLRLPLPFAAGTFEGVFAEHVIEHLDPQSALRALVECHRVLAVGGRIRVVVPDLQKYVAFYVGELPNAQFDTFANGCEAIWSLTQNWGHLSVWDSTMLGYVLRCAGFEDVEKVDFGVGRDRRLLIDKEERAWESLYMEGVKV